MLRKHFRLLITVTWVLLLGFLFTRDLFIPDISNREVTLLQKAKQERFYGIWFENKRIGYVAEVLQPEDQGYTLDQEAHILLNVLETTQPIDMNIQAQLSNGFLLENFNLEFKSPFYTMTAKGYVEENRVYFTLDTGASIINDMVTLSGPPLLAVNDRSYLIRQLKKEGQKIKIPSFDPVSLSGRESIVTYHGEEKILIRRRIKILQHFSEITGGIRINFWLDNDGRIVKEESPAGFKFIAEPEFRAKDIVSSGNEILSAVSVPLTGTLPTDNALSVSYRLSYPPDLDFDIQGGRQVLDDDTLMITLEQIPTVTTNSSNKCSGKTFTQPSPYIQSNNDKIIKLAKTIVENETNPSLQVQMLASWVYQNIEKRPVLGLPDALTTLANKKGDCNEHASLFAALARSLNINTAIATGVTLQNDAFYYHAWNEVCLDEKWYSLDTTTNQLPADLFHIRFGKGDIDEQLKIGALLGKLKIEILPQ